MVDVGDSIAEKGTSCERVAQGDVLKSNTGAKSSEITLTPVGWHMRRILVRVVLRALGDDKSV